MSVLWVFMTVSVTLTALMRKMAIPVSATLDMMETFVLVSYISVSDLEI